MSRALVVLLLLAVGRTAGAEAPSVALFYGAAPPIELLAHFDRVVVEADHVTAAQLAALQRTSRVYAYLSVGEADRDRPFYKRVDRRWILRENRAWKSDIIDPAAAGWQKLVLERMDALWRAGYRGFFLDTLDAYQAAISDEGERKKKVAALVSLLRAMHARFDGVRLFWNRGFELLPEASALADGIAAESLFSEWDAAGHRYREVSDEDRRWLLPRLREARDRYQLPVTVIDYLPPARRGDARKLAARIAALGFTPWITDGEIDLMGVGALEVMPRRVLLLRDSDEDEEHDVAYSAAHTLAQLPLEQLGYAVDIVDVRGPLPDHALTGRYAGIVTLFTDDELADSRRYRDWLLHRLDEGMRVAVLGHFGFAVDHALLARLGLVAEEHALVAPVRVAVADDLLGFEAKPEPRTAFGQLPRLRAASPELTVHLALEDRDQRRVALVATGPWGGMALEPYLLAPGFSGIERWIVDPFRFLERALALPALPMLDVTTENGARLLTIHIDGDGFPSRAEMPGTPFSAQVIRDEILVPFALPTTVSVIEGEVGPAGLYPSLAPELEVLARSIFALPTVEVASHTYSHPFEWADVLREGPTGPHGDPKRLAIPGYHFDLRREIEGSVRYIDERLAPKDKPVRVMLWSGNALPGSNAVAMSDHLGLLNVNGGNSVATREEASLSRLSPMGLPLPGGYQVYAAVQNENIYTNLWHGPFYGFRRVIETFELTDGPRRLKPVCIYYHFYSGTKVASLDALKQVYRWALAHQVLPTLLSDYARKVLEFQRATIARQLDGNFRIRGLSALRTVRLPKALGWPDLAASRGVVGARELPQGRYVHLSGDGEIRLALDGAAPRGPGLVWSNARVAAFRLAGRRATLRLRGALPVEAELPEGCRFEGTAAKQSARRWRFPSGDTGEVAIACE